MAAQPKPNNDILTIRQLANYLQLNERTVYRLAAVESSMASRLSSDSTTRCLG